jgi:hypothetical protein
VGDRDSLASLYYWTHRNPYSEKEARLKEEALKAQEALRERLEQEKQAATLLRATSQSDTATLLRPTDSAGDSAPKQLLRPAADSEE